MKKLFEEYPDLKDEKIILRKLTEGDAERLKELTSQSVTYATVPTFLYELKYPDKREVIARMDEEIVDTKESIILGVFPADEQDKLIGLAEIYNYEEDRRKASIGYRLNDSYKGRGIATAVAKLLTKYLHEELGLRTVTAHVLTDNKASKRVLEKNGFINKYPNVYEDWGFDEPVLTDVYVKKAGC